MASIIKTSNLHRIFLFHILFFNVYCDIIKVKNFLQNLELSEKWSHITVLYIGDTTNLVDIPYFLSSPKIILNQNGSLNYLNLIKYPKIITLKYNFNYGFVTFLILDKLNSSQFPYIFVYNLFAFSKNNLFVFIVNEPSTEITKILKCFHDEDFLNVIYLDIQSFEQKFLTFRRFPKYQVLQASRYVQEETSNIKGHILKILCKLEFLYSICIKNGTHISGYGRLFQLVNSFGQFINAANKIVNNGTLDIKSQSKGTPNSEYLRLFPVLPEKLSYPIEKYEIIIAIPKPKLLDGKLYLFKPFSWKLWLTILGYLVFGTFILTLTFHLVNNPKIFGFSGINC